MIRIIFPLVVFISALLGGTAAAQTQKPALAANAPDSYVVVKGDTLWGIAGRFLQQPWRWPEVWRMNQSQIRNPHLIYPGQVILLDRRGPWLSVGKPVGDDKFKPKVHYELMRDAIPTIPLGAIAPFLTQPLVSDSGVIENAATIVASEADRMVPSTGDTIFAKNVIEGIQEWKIYRKAQPLYRKGERSPVAYEAQYLGSARVVAYGGKVEDTSKDPVTYELAETIAGIRNPNEEYVKMLTRPATLEVLSVTQEILPGDILVPNEEILTFSYVPHRPEQAVEGEILSIHRGVDETAKYHVVALDIGANDGMEVGHVLALDRFRGNTEYKEDGYRETFSLPEKRYGLVFIFRVFDKVSYALVMETDGPARVGDRVRQP